MRARDLVGLCLRCSKLVLSRPRLPQSLTEWVLVFELGSHGGDGRRYCRVTRWLVGTLLLLWFKDDDPDVE